MRSTIVDSPLADIRDLLFRKATRFFVNGLRWVDFVWNQNRLLLMVVYFHLTLTRLEKMRSNLDDAGYKKLYKLPSAWFLKPYCLFPVSHPAPALRPNQGTKVGRRVNQHSLNVPRSDGIHRQIPTQPLI